MLQRRALSVQSMKERQAKKRPAILSLMIAREDRSVLMPDLQYSSKALPRS
jgi:hypothetical protein